LSRKIARIREFSVDKTLLRSIFKYYPQKLAG
jgi:hypothetical protein